MMEEASHNQQYLLAELLLALRAEAVESVDGVDNFKKRLAPSDLGTGGDCNCTSSGTRTESAPSATPTRPTRTT